LSDTKNAKVTVTQADRDAATRYLELNQQDAIHWHRLCVLFAAHRLAAQAEAAREIEALRAYLLATNRVMMVDYFTGGFSGSLMIEPGEDGFEELATAYEAVEPILDEMLAATKEPTDEQG